jgi:hypothetical protein
MIGGEPTKSSRHTSNPDTGKSSRLWSRAECAGRLANWDELSRPAAKTRYLSTSDRTTWAVVLSGLQATISEERAIRGNSGQPDGIQASDRAAPATVEMRRISLKNCPYCDCSEVYASSSATWWQKASVLFLFRLVRCNLCKRRHYRPIFVPAVENPARRPSPRKDAEGAAIKTAEKRPA